MKVFYKLIATLVILGLSGCATKDTVPEKSVAPEPNGQKVYAYYYAPYEDQSTVEEKLEDAGFEIVAVYPLSNENSSIIITNDELKEASAKPGKGFAAILRVLVDAQQHRVAVTNPVYFGKAFLQQDYSHDLGLSLTGLLKDALGPLTASPDAYNYDALEDFRFMIGMPTFDNTYLLGEGTDDVLLSKLETYDEGKDIVFKLPVGAGQTLVGFKLGKRTESFVGKIGEENAEVLPYTILIEDGKATALKVEYYIAISYPLLTMGQFMDIATLPGAVERELAKPFK